MVAPPDRKTWDLNKRNLLTGVLTGESFWFNQKTGDLIPIEGNPTGVKPNNADLP